MFRDWWDGLTPAQKAQTRRIAEEQARREERRRENIKAMEEVKDKQVAAIRLQQECGIHKLPPSPEYDRPKTCQTTMELINVCLDDWEWLSGEIEPLTKEAQALHTIERDQDIEF